MTCCYFSSSAPNLCNFLERKAIMVFDILIRIKFNRAEYIECPIVLVVKQTLHGTHGWRWGNKPHDYELYYFNQDGNQQSGVH